MSLTRRGLLAGIGGLATAPAAAQTFRPGFQPGFKSGFQFLGQAAAALPAAVWASATGFSFTNAVATKTVDGYEYSVQASNPRSGTKQYFEIVATNVSNSSRIGIVAPGTATNVDLFSSTGYVWTGSGTLFHSGGSVGAPGAYTDADVLGFGVDSPGLMLSLYKNGTFVLSVAIVSSAWTPAADLYFTGATATLRTKAANGLQYLPSGFAEWQ